jgi:pimeloyl-ACP methyl ester carboxylesterase
MPFATIDGRSIEYAAILGDAVSRPTLVFLHEGLGSVALWRDFPSKVARRRAAPALIYSRFG